MRQLIQGGMPSVTEVSSGNWAMLTQSVGSGLENDVVLTYRNDYTSTNVTTGADEVISAALAKAIFGLEIFDSSGETLQLKVNGTHKMYITPGGNDEVRSFKADVGDSIEVRAVSNNATVGELTINFYG